MRTVFSRLLKVIIASLSKFGDRYRIRMRKYNGSCEMKEIIERLHQINGTLGDAYHALASEEPKEIGNEITEN